MLDGRQPAAHPFAARQHGEVFGGGQRVAPQIQGALELGFERVEHLDDLFPTTRTHVRIIAKPADESRLTNPRLWINVQLWITPTAERPRTLAEGFRPSTQRGRA